jgi:hypothetical protein
MCAHVTYNACWLLVTPATVLTLYMTLKKGKQDMQEENVGEKYQNTR